MKCLICKRSRCIWLELKPNPEKLKTEDMEKIVSHNISYIEMVYAGHKGSAHGEEKMYSLLDVYSIELEKRKVAFSFKQRENKMKKIVNGLLRSVNEKLKAKSLETGISVNELKRNVQTAKIEQLENGDFAVTRFHSISKYSRSRSDFNLCLWYNNVVPTRALKEALENFVLEVSTNGEKIK